MSSRDDLTLFSYEMLALVGRGGAGPHDLLQMAKNGRFLAWAGESQYYVEPKRLAKLGYLDSRKEPGKTRERTVYTLNEKGLEALRTNEEQTARFFGAIAGTVPVRDFYAPENIERIMGAAVAA